MAELPPHTTCIETTWYDEAAADGGRSWVCGPNCPRPAGPDAQRDERRAAYRERERRRAVRALDRLLDLSLSNPLEFDQRSVAADRFVEAMADYMRSWARTGTYDSPHKSHYGACNVVGETCTEHRRPASHCRDQFFGGEHRNADHGVPCDYHDLPHADGCPGRPLCSLGAQQCEHRWDGFGRCELCGLVVQQNADDGSIHPEDGRACRMCEGPCLVRRNGDPRRTDDDAR